MPSSAIDYSRRVSPRELPELMDGDCSYEDFHGCLRSLEQVNRWLLGYRPTLAWLEHLPRSLHRPLHIVDVGSGGGDLLRQIAAANASSSASLPFFPTNCTPVPK